ncbi:AI-2E family transporter [Helicobacter mesocricetorum]|uniref:AI-2E family transporter n=1 Tax=Helicobacter mesocricetorum TaxID=87012 RepID=UPI000CF07420|nr:AI-2E family transporter [Helicobacter mesocricetorum]
MTNNKENYFFLIALILSVLALLKLYSPFLMNLLIAFLLFLATQGIYRAIFIKLKSNIFSSLIVTLSLLIGCFMPIIYVMINLAELATNLDLLKLQNFITYIKDQWIVLSHNLYEYLPDFVLKELNQWILKVDTINWAEIAKKGLSIFAQAGKNSLFFLSDTFFIILFLFFSYYYSNVLGKYLLNLIPLEKKQVESLYDEVSGVISVVFYSSIVSMVIQGALFGFLMFFYGYNALLFGVFYGFASLIPVIGGTLVWLPVVLYELYLGNITNAIVIILYSILIIATLADNIIKPFLIAFINRVLIKTPVKINEILIFFAIFAGITTFGFWGIVLGPAITALFIALLRVYQNIYQKS